MSWASKRPVGSWRRKVGAMLLVAGVAWGSAGCGGDAEGSDDDVQEVASGVLLDGGEPAAGVELELWVWPAPQGGATAAPELLSIDTDTTDEDGRFVLEGMVAQLSPHASGDGMVGIDVRRVGADEFLARTTVRLTKAEETGVTEVHAAEGLQINLTPAKGGEETEGGGGD
ncbi:hypothetical protein IEQ44_08130 [Nocardioides sp. Y6]|uniref:Carboxypeptidase regulatory-like domain-containing protein n=1 Tax=Nocardioides malaquae TaxID=2773426 RepID=A0ABR9RSW2_9ACTN|nr:hypothetical protein [Nocardioides malaquae]MBE7324618.1 hypothetical protein [Nocardioides malaquae]